MTYNCGNNVKLRKEINIRVSIIARKLHRMLHDYFYPNTPKYNHEAVDTYILLQVWNRVNMFDDYFYSIHACAIFTVVNYWRKLFPWLLFSAFYCCNVSELHCITALTWVKQYCTCCMNNTLRMLFSRTSFLLFLLFSLLHKWTNGLSIFWFFFVVYFLLFTLQYHFTINSWDNCWIVEVVEYHTTSLFMQSVVSYN